MTAFALSIPILFIGSVLPSTERSAVSFRDLPYDQPASAAGQLSAMIAGVGAAINSFANASRGSGAG